MKIVSATENDDHLLVAHYIAIWDSYGTEKEDYRGDAREQVQSFIDIERRLGRHAGFLAMEGNDCAGSAICGLLRSPYPEVIRATKRKRGYIWSIYVDPRFRRHGLARALTKHAVEYLHRIGCTAVLLHASDDGMGLYKKLGFGPTHEMRLDF